MEPDTFADNVAHSLRLLGHEVRTVGAANAVARPRRLDVAVSLVSERVDAIARLRQCHVAKAASEFFPEVTITVDRTLARSTISTLKNGGSRVYLWFPDAVSNLGLHECFLAGYDRIYLKNPVLAERLADIQGLPTLYMPEACNPDWHSSDVEYGTKPYLSVVGNIHPTRAVLLQRLIDAGVPVRIFGPPIPAWLGHPELAKHHAGESVYRQDKARVFRESTAVLNNLHPAEFGGTNCRLFEATAAGALVLTEARDGLDRLFEVGTEVEVFNSFDDLMVLYRRADADVAWAREIADAAAKRSLSAHTYAHRLQKMLED
ncbi:CgeB family protein [Pedococcus sp. 2YAF34]|uniref:CgeB family protein n=1 Tax=Pedococcus sp. 2YAF34 TaxID=3233032 RepID=UPI003F9AFF10